MSRSSGSRSERSAPSRQTSASALRSHRAKKSLWFSTIQRRVSLSPPPASRVKSGEPAHDDGDPRAALGPTADARQRVPHEQELTVADAGQPPARSRPPSPRRAHPAPRPGRASSPSRAGCRSRSRSPRQCGGRSTGCCRRRGSPPPRRARRRASLPALTGLPGDGGHAAQAAARVVRRQARPFLHSRPRPRPSGSLTILTMRSTERSSPRPSGVQGVSEGEPWLTPHAVHVESARSKLPLTTSVNQSTISS